MKVSVQNLNQMWYRTAEIYSLGEKKQDVDKIKQLPYPAR